MVAIAKRAAEIRKDFERVYSEPNFVEIIARIFEDDAISDTGAGTPLARRLTTILNASADPIHGGVTHFSGILAGWDDRGFLKQFQDPWGSFSNNQVGHFLTAVDMGFQPHKTVNAIGSWATKIVNLRVMPGMTSQEEVCIRLIIGHEQVGDNVWKANWRQAIWPNIDDVRIFCRALVALGSNIPHDWKRAEAILRFIKIGKGRGNSLQDLLLSLMGFLFGLGIRRNFLTKIDQGSYWIRSNLGEGLPVLPPLAPRNKAVA